MYVYIYICIYIYIYIYISINIRLRSWRTPVPISTQFLCSIYAFIMCLVVLLFGQILGGRLDVETKLCAGWAPSPKGRVVFSCCLYMNI